MTDTAKLGLASLTDPVASDGHILRVRAKKDTAAGQQVDLVATLRESGTARATLTMTDLTSSFADYSVTLSGSEADAITSYSGLEVWLAATGGTTDPDTAPSYRSAGTAQSSATNGAGVTPGLPTGWQADDILILHIHQSQTGTAPSVTGTWTELTSPAVGGNNANGAHQVRVYWRRAVGGDTAPTVTLNAAGILLCRIYAFSGCVTSGSPFDTGSKSDSAADATIEYPSVNTGQRNVIAVLLGAYEDDPTTHSTPAGGWSVPSGNVSTTSTGNDAAINIFHQTFATSGSATGATSSTVSGGTFANSPSIGIVLTLKGVPLATRRAVVSWVQFQVPGTSGTTEFLNAAGTLALAGANIYRVGKTPAGTLTGSGALVRSVGKILAGTLTTSGALIKSVTQTFAGTLTTAGALTKSIPQSFAGTLSASGALLKSPALTFAGTLSTAGALIKSATQTLAGTLAPTGSLTKLVATTYNATLTMAGDLAAARVVLLTVTGTLTTAGDLIKSVGKTASGTLTGAGALISTVGKLLAGTLTTSGDLSATKVVLLSVAGTLGLSGALTTAQTILQTFAGTLSTSGALLKSVTQAFVGTLASSGALLKSAAVTFAGTLTTSGTLATMRVVLLTLTGTLATSGALIASIAQTFGGTLAPTGALIKSVGKVFAGTLATAGSLTAARLVSLLAAGTLGLSGALTTVKTIALSAAGTLGLSGALTKSVTQTFSGTLALSGALTKRVTQVFAGVLSLAGAILTEINPTAPVPIKTFYAVARSQDFEAVGVRAQGLVAVARSQSFVGEEA